MLLFLGISRCYYYYFRSTQKRRMQNGAPLEVWTNERPKVSAHTSASWVDKRSRCLLGPAGRIKLTAHLTQRTRGTEGSINTVIAYGPLKSKNKRINVSENKFIWKPSSFIVVAAAYSIKLVVIFTNVGSNSLVIYFLIDTSLYILA